MRVTLDLPEEVVVDLLADAEGDLETVAVDALTLAADLENFEEMVEVTEG